MIGRSILNDPIAARPTDRFRSMALTAPELFGRLEHRLPASRQSYCRPLLLTKPHLLYDSSAGGKPFHDAVPFAKRLIDNAPDRVLWGTDWPHPDVRLIQRRQDRGLDSPLRLILRQGKSFWSKIPPASSSSTEPP
jgi:hypothetical protein